MDSPEPEPPFNGRGFRLLAHPRPPRPLRLPGPGVAGRLPARAPPRLGP